MSVTLTTKPTLAERVQELTQRAPRRMTPAIARELGVPEAEVIAHLPDARSTALELSQWEAIIRDFERLGKVHVVCNTGVVVLESFGTFGNFSTVGDFFNVQTKIDMHIRYKELGSVYAVIKPGHMDGKKTLSFQFFTRKGDSAFKVFLTFGGKDPNSEQEAIFSELVDKYRIQVA